MEKETDFIIKNTEELDHNIRNYSYSNKVSACFSTITSLSNINKLNRIVKLRICAMDPLELYEDTIIETDNLKQLNDLEDLSIENDDHIKSLNLTGLDNLQKLSVSSCHMLRNIEGLSNLKKLKELIIYDVPNLTNDFYDELINYIDHSSLEKIVLDINSFLIFSQEQLEKLRLRNVLFSEKIGIKDNYVFTFQMMEDFNKKVIKIYHNIHKHYIKRDDILFAFYTYVKNTKYDGESLAKRHKYVEDGGKFYKFQNRYKAINSSYKALMKKSAVCEGYVNLLRYFYKLENIDLYPVFCDYEESSHVAAKALIDGTEVYFDPELDHRFDNYNNFMINKKDFEKNHKIMFSRDNFDLIINLKNKERRR